MLNRYDRNIFNGEGKEYTIICIQEVELRRFYAYQDSTTKIDNGVKFKAQVYPAFRRAEWIPIQYWIGDIEFCGWIDSNKITLVS